MKTLFSLIITAILFVSCSKQTSSEAILDPSESNLTIIPPTKEYSIDELLDLAELYDATETEKSQIELSPEDFKYALETRINRDLRAGTNLGNSRQSHVFVYDYSLNSNGKLTGEFFDDLYNSTINEVTSIEALGGEFYIVDVELVQGQQIMIDVITVVGYVNTGLAFGFMLLPDNNSYQIVQDDFDNLINDRIIFEAIDDNEYFLTDIYPNPVQAPDGLTISRTDAIGPLGIGDCTMYRGTLEVYGGPELVYGNAVNKNVWFSGAEANEKILRGINNIESRVPSGQGLQLISLTLEVGETLQNLGGGCLNDACDEYYPCFAYHHTWKDGVAARKLPISK